MGKTKIAVVLFNLGGPDGPRDVEPFLFNLFNDKAIIQLPFWLRTPLAKLISRTRAPSARENYAKMGGGSPLLAETKRQAKALEAYLVREDREVRAFIAMRYWRPFVKDAVEAVEAWEPDEVVLLPLYPQYSTTTTGSSLGEWRKFAPDRPVKTVCCYPSDGHFAAAHAAVIHRAWTEAGSPENIRVLYSAHGLPQKIVDQGDPYQWQVEQTVEAVSKNLPELRDSQICYQSRVGPLKWIGPSTEEAIEAAASDRKDILLVPIAFVSEHIETLVELDEEYRELAEELGVKRFLRAPALGVEYDLVKALAQAVESALVQNVSVCSSLGRRLCPIEAKQCPAGRLA